MSNISVSVEWDQPTIFAGEEVRCKITFRNAAIQSRSRSPSPNSQLQTLGSGRDRWKLGSVREHPSSNTSTTARSSEHPTRPQNHSRRSTISLHAPVGTTQDHPTTSGPASSIVQSKHSRSVSIISIASQPGDANEEQDTGTSKRIQRVKKAHGRSASFQGLPFRSGTHSANSNGSPLSGPTSPLGLRSSTSPYPLQRSATIKYDNGGASETTAGYGLSSLATTAVTKVPNKHNRSGSDTRDLAMRLEPPAGWPSQFNGHAERQPFNGVRHHLAGTKELPTNRPVQRVLSPLSMEGTPRSSVDFYTQSNNSSETLASEYLSPALQQQPYSSRHIRQGSYLAPVSSFIARADTLMMGYVQLLGTFTLDGSLVTLAPFESVKRKGVIGGQGSGGVVGVEHSKRESGLFGSLGWGNIGQSLGGLLGSQEPSSLREMKGIASTKSIPILSTPQSILFVDLKLSPGESKTYSYCHVLPEGLPPTHKGRAFKSSYQLVIGVQRPQGVDKQHKVRQVDVPFRVLPGVDGAGEVLGHDLMNPHVMLRDMALTRDIDESQGPVPIRKVKSKSHTSIASIDDGFTAYVDNLLRKSRQNSNMSLLSPTEPTTPGLVSSSDLVPMKERIDMTILRGSAASRGKSTASRFQIHRDGVKIANVTLGRSAYRLGEMVTSTVDMSHAELPCYALNVTLESSETIDPSIALRSAASIQRATRRIHASSSEIAISARKIVIGTIVPLTATPEFNTSGLRLDWSLRFEFITGANAGPDGDVDRIDDLLENINEDERGTTTAAVQELPCQSFDVAVPIRVYGTAKAVDDGTKPQVYPI